MNSRVWVDDGSGRRRGAQVTTVNCAIFQEQDPQSLGVTYWFDALPDGMPYDLEVRFTGTMLTEEPATQPQTFTATRTIRDILPGIGTMAYTARFTDIAPGQWHVAIQATAPGAAVSSGPDRTSAQGHTAFGPVIRELAPGMAIGAWPWMVGLGAMVGIGALLLLTNRYDIPTAATLMLAFVACLLGLVGAKVYFLLQSKERTSLLSTGGMCIQGFVIAAFATLVVGSLLLGLPAATLLDLTAPGLMLGMVFGRVGCWRGGCCVGRPSTSRFALWSSDRRVGVKRIPVQLIEGAVAGGIGVLAILVAWWSLPQPPGALFVAVISAYVLARQLLFALRDQARRTRKGRHLALLLSAVVLVVSLILLALETVR